MDPSYADLVLQVADLKTQVLTLTAERDQLQAEVNEQEWERSRKRRLEYQSRGWGAAHEYPGSELD